MAKLYIIEHKYKEGTISRWAKLLTFFTRNNYYHTAFLIEERLGRAIFFNFNIKENQTTKLYFSLQDYFKNTNRIIDYELLPFDITSYQVNKIIDWWGKQKYPFSKRKTIFAALRRIFMPLIWHYYKWKGKPYKPWMDAPERDYCTTITDKCIKQCIGYDVIPELNENIAYPGLMIQALRRKA